MSARIFLVFGLAIFAGIARASSARGNPLDDVRNELAGLKSPHPWADTYYGPIDLSYSFIQLAPSGKFCLETFFDGGGTVEGNCGRLKLVGDRFVTDGRPQDWETKDPNGPPYLRIPWGKRHYLVPERRVVDFIDGVNALTEPRGSGSMRGSFAAYLRKGEADIAVVGPPSLPNEYQGKLLTKPLQATAVETAERTNIITRIRDIEDDDCGADARFDIGSSSGAFVGMELHAQASDVQARVVLATVTADSSWGRIKQYDCDTTDPLPPRTRFATRPQWRMGAVLSTEPLHIDVRFASRQRFSTFYAGTPASVYEDDPFAGAREAGFSWTKVADITLRDPSRGPDGRSGPNSRQERAILSIGGNLIREHLTESEDRSDDPKATSESTIEVYRVSYEGTPIDPDSDFSLALHSMKTHRGEPSRCDWKKAVLGARSALCPAQAFVHEKKRLAALEILHWDEKTLARAYDLRFDELRPDQRAAAEAVVPEALRGGFVWTALMDDKSSFKATLLDREMAAEQEYRKAHPESDAECERLRMDSITKSGD